MSVRVLHGVRRGAAYWGSTAAFCSLVACNVGPHDNVSACADYVDKANAALVACGSQAIYSVEETCPESIEVGPDCAEYYNCLGEGYVCTTETRTLTIEVSHCSCDS